MPGDFDTMQATSGVYASAVLELAQQAGQEDAVDAELGSLRELVATDRAFAAFLASPAIDRDARRESLRKLLSSRLSPIVMNLLLVLNDKHRLAVLPHVCDGYRRMLELHRGQHRTYVTSAVPLTPEQRAKLVETVQRLSGFVPILVERVDPAVLGGVRVQMDDKLFDRTVSSRLRRLRAELMAGVDTHLHIGEREFFKGVA